MNTTDQEFGKYSKVLLKQLKFSVFAFALGYVATKLMDLPNLKLAVASLFLGTVIAILLTKEAAVIMPFSGKFLSPRFMVVAGVKAYILAILMLFMAIWIYLHY